MFDLLDAPTDLGAARARLLATADRLAGPAPIHHLAPIPLDRDGAGRPWPTDDDGGLAAAGVIVADSVLWRAGPAALESLAEAVGADRSLLFLEPTADLGWRRLVHRFGRPLWLRAAGHHFETDVPVLLRAAGLEVVEIRRFGVGRAGVRSYAMGRARRFDEPLSPG